MQLNLKSKISLFALLALTTSFASIAAQNDGRQEQLGEDAHAVELKVTAVVQDAGDKVNGGVAVPTGGSREALVPPDDIMLSHASDAAGATANIVTDGRPKDGSSAAGGAAPVSGLAPKPPAPVDVSIDGSAGGSGQREPSAASAAASADSSQLKKSTGKSDRAGGGSGSESPNVSIASSLSDSLAAPAYGPSSLAASMIVTSSAGSPLPSAYSQALPASTTSSPVAPVCMKVDLCISEYTTTTLLGVEVQQETRELPYLTSQVFKATNGKSEFMAQPVRRILNLSSQYPIVTLAFLTLLESIVNHKDNLDAPGRAQYGVPANKNIQIHHLFPDVIGVSEGSMPAALLYLNGKTGAINDLRYFVRRGYLSYNTLSSDGTYPYTIEGRKKFLSGVIGPERFADGVVNDRKLHIPVFNVKTGKIEVASNSTQYVRFSQVPISSVLEAASAAPDMFPPQYLPLGHEEGPFQDGIQGVDTAFSIYQRSKATTKEASYQVFTIGSESRKADKVTDIHGFLKRARQMANQSLAAKFSADIEDPRAPIISFTSFQFTGLGKADDFSPTHIITWVDEGIQAAMYSTIFRQMVTQLGFKMPELSQLVQFRKEIMRYVLFDLESPKYKGLAPEEQDWLKRVLVADTRNLGFSVYANLSHRGVILSPEQRLNLLHDITAHMGRDPEREKWHKAWSAKDLPLSEGILKGHEFANVIAKFTPLVLEDIFSPKASVIENMLKNFMTAVTSNENLFGVQIDAYTPFLARIYLTYMLKDVKAQADPSALRDFAARCLQKATANLGLLKAVRNSREYQLAEEFVKYVGDTAKPAK